MVISMSKSAALLLVLLLTASGAITFLPVNAESRTIVVPDDYATISDAIGNATEGTTMYLKKGIYEIKKNPLKINKTLSIIGEDQANTILVSPPDTRVGYATINPKVALCVFADNFKISNLTITNSNFGISVTGNGTQVSHMITSGVYLDGSYCKISENNLSIDSSRPNTIAVKGSFNEIAHNNILNDSGNIQCEGSFNNINGNAGARIEVTGDSNFVARNYFMDVSLSDSNLNTMYNNSVSCISLSNCYNNTVCGNVVKGPSSVQGIFMGVGSGNVFYGNNITDFNGVFATDESPYGYGVALGSDDVAEKNLFYHNNFVNNYKDVSANWPISGAGNYWDNGEEGNYWDGYSGIDNNGDGIGDVEYTIRGQKWDADIEWYVEFVFGQDHYPLMAPFDISSVTVEFPNWTYQLPNPPSTPSPLPSLEPEPETSEPFPVAPVAAASVASGTVVAAGLLLYFRKRNR